MKSFTLLLVLIFITEPLLSASEKETYVIVDQGKDFMVPSKIYEIISNPELSSFKRQLGSILFSPITVRLKEKNKGILTHPEIEFRFPKGGGEIDLSRYTSGRKGTFYVFFEFDEDVPDKEYYNTLFVSKTKKRRIGNTLFGSGCYTILDIKNYYFSTIKRYGLPVNTTGNRHTTTIGGHFIFSYYTNRHYAMSQVTFTDKKNLDLFCE